MAELAVLGIPMYGPVCFSLPTVEDKDCGSYAYAEQLSSSYQDLSMKTIASSFDTVCSYATMLHLLGRTWISLVSHSFLFDTFCSYPSIVAPSDSSQISYAP
eukprot:gene14022-19958_t